MNEASGKVSRRNAEWDISAAPHNYLFLFLTQGISALVAFAAVWLASGLLGPAGYGRVMALIAASQLIIQIAMQWTSGSLWRFGCEEFVETGSIAKAFWARTFLWAPSLLLVTGLSYWWLSPLATWLGIPSEIRLLIPAYCLVTGLWLHIQAGLQAAKLPSLLSVLIIVERIVIVVLVLTCILINQASVLTIAVGYVVAPLIPATAGLWRLRTLITPALKTNRAMLRRLIKFSLPLLLFHMAGCFTSNYLDTFFITHYLSATDLGVYLVTYQIAGTVMQLPVLGNSLLTPLFVTLQSEDRREKQTLYLNELLPLLVLIWANISAVAALAGGYVLPLLFGDKYQPVAILLWPMMAAAGLAGPVLLGYSAMTNAQSATHLSALAAVLSALCNILLNFVLIPPFGLLGCAWATTLSYGVSMFIFSSIHATPRTGRRRVLEATLPIVMGAFWVTRTADARGGFLLVLILSTILIRLRRNLVLTGLRVLCGYRQRRVENPGVVQG